MKRIISILLLVCILALSMSSCSVSEKKLIGIWRGDWEYNENEIRCIFELKEDGTYSEVTFKRKAGSNGDFYISSTESGYYEIKGKEVSLCDSPGSRTVYKYKSGKLENGGHYYERIEE